MRLFADTCTPLKACPPPACRQAHLRKPVNAPRQVHFNPKSFDFGKDKAFPLRDQHFFTSVDKVLWCFLGRGDRRDFLEGRARSMLLLHLCTSTHTDVS